MGQSSKSASLISAFFDFIINLGSAYLAFLILDESIVDSFGKKAVAEASIVALASVVLYFICDIYSYKKFAKLHREILRLGFAQLFIISVLILIVAIANPEKRGYYYLILCSASISFLILSIKKVLITKIIHSLNANKKFIRNVLIVGNHESAEEYERQINDNLHFGYTIIGCVTDSEEPRLEKLGGYSQLEEVIKEKMPDEVLIAVDFNDESEIQNIINICDNNGIRTSIIPPAYKYFKSKCQVDMVGNLPIINTRAIPLDNLANAAMKRLMDIVISLIMIVLTSPIMIIAFLGVKLTSKGPAIFKQTRVGKNNREFTMYKFRSMKVNKEEQTGWTTPDDKRKTRFGTFMRKTGIDELPQLFNVLFGSMSIVGPRPELPNHVEEFSKTIPLYKVKHQVKPGITGLAQIYGFRGDTSIEGRIEMDIKYIESWSLFSDIKIIFITPFKMFNRNEKFVK